MEFVGNSPDLKKALAHPVKPKGGVGRKNMIRRETACPEGRRHAPR
jgi:hypothetical protein